MEIKKVDGRLAGWTDVPLDLYTPVSAFITLRNYGAVFLLESVEKGEKLGRYSFIGLDPEDRIIVDAGILKTGNGETSINRTNIKRTLDSLMQERYDPNPEEIVFAGGWAGYAGYEFASFLDEIELKKEDNLFPLLYLFKIKKLLIFDHVKHTGKILVSGNGTGEKEIKEYLTRIKNVLTDQPVHRNQEKSLIKQPEVKLSASLSESEYIRIVNQTKEYIKAGDIFQAVLSIKFEGRSSASPFDIYRALRILNPSPYMFYFDFGDFQIIGSSPESHLKVDRGKVSIRPIAGTRGRGKTRGEDLKLENQLINDPKERAEHAMLIDLARNDLGKLCRTGTVKITEKMSVERYSHVMHLVSQVEGQLNQNITFFDLLQATFPAGTVTGAPKIRAMQIIDLLEPVARGPYAGVVGYYGFNGNLDLCIGIRMIIYKQGTFFLQGGAGIVIGSRPESEYLEVQKKIKGMLEAINLAEGGGF
ncbi:MAG: anthranilate synthase component I family protein [Candidatus Saccharicenans sp.]|uniref:anthranilate synthase component I family protein n=1 Tax=Candidatus Saccharicenans sp. TaxID=2819258 RepID=UPI00404B8584